jgi:phosphoglycerol transferase MdoB-like AlkP superfamily enzyme
LLFITQDDRAKTDNECVEFYSNLRMNIFVKAVVGIAATLLMVIPIILLYLLTVHGASGWLRIVTLLLFVVLFTIALAILTRATRQEMFAASAA